MSTTATKDKHSCDLLLHVDAKKNAEEELDREIGNVSEMEAVKTGDKGESGMAKRSGKRKS